MGILHATTCIDDGVFFIMSASKRSPSAAAKAAAAVTTTMESTVSKRHVSPSRQSMSRRRFPNYIPFGYHTTMCLAIFFLSYATFLMCLVPLLRTPRTPKFSGVAVAVAVAVSSSSSGSAVIGSSDSDSDGHGHGQKTMPAYYYTEHHGDALKPALDPLIETYEHLPFVAEELAEAVQKRFDDYVEERGLGGSVGNVRKKENAKPLPPIPKAEAEAKAKPKPNKPSRHIRKQQQPPAPTAKVVSEKQKKDAATVATYVATAVAAVAAVEADSPPGKPTGVMVLGMHRSGTRILSGLLVEGMGYFGGPQMKSDSSVSFERLDVVLQNDLFLHEQHMSWKEPSSRSLGIYDPERAWHDHKLGKVGFHKGESALRFLNNPDHHDTPWLQKDPRMCITLKTWLPLLHNEPVVLFTYRHPLQVARSLKRDQKVLRMDHAFQLWIVYNMRAIQNSAGLCRVVTSHDVVLEDPLTEVQRIADELTTKCGVPEPPRRLTRVDVDKFVDVDPPSAQHHTKRSVDASRDHGTDSDCAHQYITEYEETSDHDGGYVRERDLYLKAMQIYCDIQRRQAFEEDYKWPKIYDWSVFH